MTGAKMMMKMNGYNGNPVLWNILSILAINCLISASIPIKLSELGKKFTGTNFGYDQKKLRKFNILKKSMKNTSSTWVPGMQNGTPHDDVDKSNLKDARGTSSGLFIFIWWEFISTNLLIKNIRIHEIHDHKWRQNLLIM